VLKLHRPKKEEMRVIVSVEKNRHKCEQQKLLWPFEISLIRNGQGNLEWATRPAAKAQRIAAFDMFKNKMPTPLAGQEVGVSRATIYRWKQEFDENQNPDFHTDPEE
jgi:DNA invertase Pin-like site-specific DNA recombinase